MEQDILVYQSELTKGLPDKCTLRHAICTTMSIDPSTMLQTIVQLADYSSQVLKRVKRDEISTILLSVKNQFWFFHDAKHPINFQNDACLKDAPLPDEQNAALLRMAVPVECSGPFFHPKIILLEYENESGETFYRLQVSSKNLTSAYHFEVGAVLESQKISGEEAPNHNLGDFLRYLAEKAALYQKEIDGEKNPLYKEKLTRITDELKQIAGELERCRFSLSGDEDKRTDRVQVTVSGAHDGLRTQTSLIKRLSPECPDRPQKKDPSLLILSPSYETSQKALNSFCVYEPIEVETHAKLYFCEKTRTLWLGSSNLSPGGMENNVECMVEIHDAEGICRGEDDHISVFGTKCKPLTEATTRKDDTTEESPPIECTDELFDKLRNDGLRSFLDKPWFRLAGKRDEQSQALCDRGIKVGEELRSNSDLDEAQRREVGYAVDLLRHYREYWKNCADR